MKSISILILAVGVGYVERSSIAHILPYIKNELGYSHSELGYVLSAFGWGYVLGLPFSGHLIARYGHRNILSAICAAWALSAISFSQSDTITGMFVSRFALGVSEAPLFPLFISWIAGTAKRSNISSNIAVVEASSYVGMAISGPLSVLMANWYGWRIAYTGIGILGVFVIILSRWLEGELHEKGNCDHGSSSNYRASRVIPILMAGSAGFLMFNYIKNLHSTWLPTILIEFYGYRSSDAAWLTFSQSLAAPVFSIIFGFMSSYLMSRWSIFRARVGVMLIGFAVGALIILAPDSKNVSYIVASSYVGVIATSAIIWSLPGDLYRDHVSVAKIAGYYNAVANVGTIASPIVNGYFISWYGGKDIPFFAAGMASFICMILFAVAYIIARKDAQNEG